MTTFRNNITRFLDIHQIQYSVHTFADKKFSALEVADILGVNPDFVYKSIVLKRTGRGKSILAVVPATGNADPKKIAVFLDEKKIFVTTMREAESITGSLAGGISPLSLVHKSFQILIDHSIEKLDQVFVSGGKRGVQIRLPVHELVKLVNANVADISNTTVNSIS